MKVNPQLIKKYNSPVPRYTSYPPANHFTDGVGVNKYQELLQASNNQEPEQIAFYFHIPFCHKMCFFCGCNAYPLGSKDRGKRYMTALMNELDMVLPHIDKTRKVSQIHFGGGTPNAIDAGYLIDVVNKVKANFQFIDEVEIAIECNPAHLNHNYINQLLAAGFNRFSLGIQDFNNDVLRKVNRDESALPIDVIMQEIKHYNINNSINFDFIYGLPNQTPENFAQTIQKAIDYRPDRLVTFSYAHVPWMKRHQSILEKLGLPLPEEKMLLFLTAYHLLLQAGYHSIGLDHFVLPSDELFLSLQDQKLHRNFQGYCTRKTTGQVYALGVSSISQLQGGYVQNNKDLMGYIEAIEKGTLATERGYVVTPQQFTIKEVITELMCNKIIDWPHLAEKLKIDEDEIKGLIHWDNEKLLDFQNDGILTITNYGLQITELGALFIRNVAAEIDPAFSLNSFKYSKSV